MRVGDDFRIRFNSELYKLLNVVDVVQRINIQQLCWLGHVVRMEENALARRVFDAGIWGRLLNSQFNVHYYFMEVR